MPSTVKKITNRVVDSMAAGDTVWDDGVSGFGIRRRARAASYVLKTITASRQVFLTIGQHGSPWTPDTARAEAKRLLGRIAAGDNPADERTKAREAPNFAAVAERFMIEHVKPHRKANTAENYESALRLHITPKLGTMRIDAITHRDIAKLHGSLANVPTTANKVAAILSKLFNWAAKRGLIDRGANPATGVEKFKERTRERFLSTVELVALGDALIKAEAIEPPSAIAALRLLVLTGARRDEILTAKWSYVDAERRILLLPDSKTGAKPIFLSPAALTLLDSLPRIEGNDFILPGHKHGQRFVGLNHVWLRVRKLANLDNVRIHDLRHSFASVAAARGGSLLAIGKLLGHSQAVTTQRYAHLATDPLRELNDAAGSHIAEAINRNRPAAPASTDAQPTKTGEVIALHKRTA